jgi:cyclase
MPLAHRIIPTFLVKDGNLVKGKRFAGDRVVGHALQAIMIQAARGVDEMVLLDIGATARGKGPNLELVGKLTDRLFSPLAVGGGIYSVEDVRAVLREGADKVVLGSLAVESPRLMYQIARVVGNQAIVASLDVRAGIVFSRNGKVASTVIPSPHPPTMAAMLQDHGAGEILLQSIDRDGMMCGYDLDLIADVRQAVTLPIVASGGCGTYEHMLEALDAGASAVAAGAMFLFTDQTPAGAARYLAEHGVEVRL